MAHTLKRVPKREHYILVRVDGQLIVGNRQDLKHAVLHQLEQGEREFVFDFARNGYIDCSGLGVLVALNKKIREHGGRMTIRNLNDDNRLLFRLTALDNLFTIEEDAA